MTNNTPLTFSPEEVASNYPAFFKRYPIKPEVTAIGSIFQQNFDVAKKKLRDFFPFQEDGRLKMATYEDGEFIASNAFPNTLSLLRVIGVYCGGFSDEEILSNRKADGAKVSRFVLAKYKADSLIKREIDNRITWQDLCLELPLLPLNKRHDFETVVQNFYSELAKVKDSKVDMLLSVNPYDIANASNGGRFSSCNALGGMHENAPICAAASPAMAIIKLENSATKELLGRCYVSVSLDFKSFVVQPTYGYMKEDFVRDAEKWMCAYINSKLGDEDAQWFRHANLDTIHPQYVSDCKLANFYVDNSASVYHRKDYGALPAIRLGDCHCLVCGELCLSVVCDKCKKTKFGKCRFCSKPTEGGTDLCDYHKEHLRVCPDCNEEFSSDDPKQVRCNDCLWIHTRCVVCGWDISVKRDGSQDDVTELLGGLLYAHTHCVKEDQKYGRKCHTCGKRTNGYSRCFFCTTLQEGRDVANRVLHQVKRFRQRLTWDAEPADISVGAHMLLPTASQHNYAIAA